ncbi:MAG: hypothetical protein IKJ84_04870 [Oscillospiraceae bacterium]|nr:hypothetical protein [Oscillospiraceae bacterium]
MKKLFSIVLALTMVLAMTACGSKTTAETTVPAQEMPASALEIMETVWADYADEEKFPVIGGSMAAPVDGAPGSYDLADENITYSLLIPADQLANVTEAASMIHMMNANTFTGACYKLADGVKAAAFGEAMKAAVMGNQWMCGFPDKLFIGAFGDSYVVVAFGVNDAMNPFQQHFSAVYPGFETLVDEAIA